MATNTKKIGQSGFSLIELMVAMAIGSIVLAGIYGAYQDQLRTSLTQQRIVDMNQNLRVAIMILERELRMGGANPTGNATAGITTAQTNNLVIAMDDGGTLSDALTDGIDNDEDGAIDETGEGEEWYDGDTNDQGEVVMFDLVGGNLRWGFNAAGSTDPTAVPGNIVPIASNIDAIDFVYMNGDDPPAVIPAPVTGNDLDDIRYVQVTIVARAGVTDQGFVRKHTDNTVYRNPQGTVVFTAPGDQFRRRMVTTTIKCRNMGL
ncbi:prepilin-type N-terminal cleavage/methylation domain-containing protein [uncultured Desulfosarcina sp.]|uniref:prepilin-type N-terminal cleavage/methylation domain-containing protein n=1 Tax=uncultured Desulfosarcina sp. TaxID=218289 RepID=UPI0029C9251B|nr:prepilin-type N-terminal cleavage/methylation domain-containing protein [uncultured Desulfosarcina sp.]